MASDTEQFAQGTIIQHGGTSQHPSWIWQGLNGESKITKMRDAINRASTERQFVMNRRWFGVTGVDHLFVLSWYQVMVVGEGVCSF